MGRSRIQLGLAAIATLVATTDCGTSPSNPAANGNDQEPAANVAATDNAQNVAELIVPKMPPAPDPSTLEGRTEAAMIDQLRCTKHPEAAKVVNAMVANRLLKKLDEGTDGSPIFGPTRPLFLMGFPIVHVSGWQMTKDYDPVPPFYRAPGMLPPMFFQVTVRGSPRQVRSATTALGIQEEGISGIRIEDEDLWGWHTKMTGVTTLTCATMPTDFPDYFGL